MLDIMREKSQSLLIKILFGIIILVFVFWGFGSFNARDANVLAKVNGKNISMREFTEFYNRQVRMAKVQMPNLPDDFFRSKEQRMGMLGALIDKELLSQEADKINFEISSAEITKAISSITDFKGEDGKFDYKRYVLELSNQGLTTSDFEKKYSNEMRLLNVQRYIASAAVADKAEARESFNFLEERRKVEYIPFANSENLPKPPSSEQINAFYEKNKQMFFVPRSIDLDYVLISPAALASSAKYNVTDEEVAAYYKNNESSFVDEEKFKIRQILIAVPADATSDDIKKASEKADKIYKQVQGGASFSKLAKENSDDANSKHMGGDMGSIGKKEISPSLLSLISGLKPGEAAAPFMYSDGIHILYLDSIEKEKKKTLPEMREQIRKKLASEKAAQDILAILDKGVKDILDGVKLEDIAKGIGLNILVAKGLKKGNANEAFAFTKDAADAVFLTPEGITVDRPLNLQNGEYMLARVTKVAPEHVAPLDGVKERVIALINADESRVASENHAKEMRDFLNEGADRGVKLPGTVKVSSFFRRSNGPDFGGGEALSAAVFAATSKKEWLGPFKVKDGEVIVRLNDVQQPDDGQWDKVADKVQASYLSFKQTRLVSAFITDLKARAKIEVFVPENWESKE